MRKKLFLDSFKLHDEKMTFIVKILRLSCLTQKESCKSSRLTAPRLPAATEAARQRLAAQLAAMSHMIAAIRRKTALQGKTPLFFSWEGGHTRL